MTGARNGVAKLLKDENPLILTFHCLAHKLALAFACCADTLDYIARCELQLNQLWRLFENSAKRTATYLKVQESTKNLSLHIGGREQVAKKLKACHTHWLSLDKSVEAVFTDFYAIIKTLEQLKTEPTGSATDGLLKGMKNVKFINLHDVLPVLSELSKCFQQGNINFSHLRPASKATQAKLNRLTTLMYFDILRHFSQFCSCMCKWYDFLSRNLFQFAFFSTFSVFLLFYFLLCLYSSFKYKSNRQGTHNSCSQLMQAC